MSRKQKLFLQGLLLVLFTAVCFVCFARAGGSSSTGLGFWKIIIFIILLPFILIYAAVVSIVTARKKNKAKSLAQKLEITDSVWNQRTMSARAEEVFLNVQKAWMERNMDLAKDYITDRLYTNYKFQTDDMLKRGVKNYMQDIQVKDVAIFSIEDYKDNNKDSFSAKISGTMLDYELSEATDVVTKGDRNKSHFFEDIYTFVRQGNTWLADAIHNDASLSDISKGRAFSEG